MDQQQGENKLSKKQQKKLAKKEKQREYYKEKKIQKKQIRKQQKQEQKSNIVIDDDNKIHNQERQHKKPREQYQEEMKNGIKIIIDLQFMSQMTIHEKTSLYKQIELCHSNNFKSKKPLNLIVTSLTEDFKQLLNKSNASNWGIELNEKPYIDLFKKEDLVYLTGDTEDVIDELNQEEVYIIGGLVDHNRLKLITYNKAIEQGIKTKKLPINLNLKTSSILTVNQVFEILLRRNNGEDWNDSVQNTIPKRKLL
ncbi:unnamed protein product [Paramecium primaurelia]|uniref:tRNA (guanine(9)-N(1))-methyltransferase n=1 Tax=Paramecium primaurelia TaxID=5886 RepID=A0A8S1JZQ8_PARPR|nr:unnamed protein product [Paramecium primaurelia]